MPASLLCLHSSSRLHASARSFAGPAADAFLSFLPTIVLASNLGFDEVDVLLALGLCLLPPPIVLTFLPVRAVLNTV